MKKRFDEGGNVSEIEVITRTIYRAPPRPLNTALPAASLEDAKRMWEETVSPRMNIPLSSTFAAKSASLAAPPSPQQSMEETQAADVVGVPEEAANEEAELSGAAPVVARPCQPTGDSSDELDMPDLDVLEKVPRMTTSLKIQHPPLRP